MKHTPGPWSVSDTSILAGAYGEYCIAVIEDDGGHEAPGEEQEANAQLIAAAPELLAEMEHTCNFALELMARAAGIDRLFLASQGKEPEYELGEVVRMRQQLGSNRAAIAKAKGDPI